MDNTKSTIRIDIVSDIVCPWCIIGYKRLEKALELVAETIVADIHWHPFILNSHLSADQGTNYKNHLMHKYGRTEQEVVEVRANLTEIGAGLDFRFDYFEEMETYNSIKGHQLIRYAREEGKETELKYRLMSAFFSERKNIASIDVLLDEAVSIGLDRNACLDILEKDTYKQAVLDEIAEWSSMGVNSVPTYIINQKYAIPGAQEPQTFANALLQIAGE